MSINENIFLLLAMVALLVVWLLNMMKGKGKRNGKKLNKLKCDSPKRVHGIPFGRQGNKVVYSPTNAEGHVGIFAGTGAG